MYSIVPSFQFLYMPQILPVSNNFISCTLENINSGNPQVGGMERDQISDIRPPKNQISDIRPKKNQISDITRSQISGLKNQISDPPPPKKINYQISPPPPPPSDMNKTLFPLVIWTKLSSLKWYEQNYVPSSGMNKTLFPQVIWTKLSSLGENP